MGSKISAKNLAKEVGVPAVPGIAKSVESMEEVRSSLLVPEPISEFLLFDPANLLLCPLVAAACCADWLPGDDQGQQRRRRQGHARGL
jgi:hypothetical protein